MRFALTLSALLVLAGCTTTAPATSPPVADAATDAAQCAASGGQMQPLGRLQREQCVVAYADAGKTCSSKADCTGQCLASGDTERAPVFRAGYTSYLETKPIWILCLFSCFNLNSLRKRVVYAS